MGCGRAGVGLEAAGEGEEVWRVLQEGGHEVVSGWDVEGMDCWQWHSVLSGSVLGVVAIARQVCLAEVVRGWRGAASGVL